MKQMAFYVLLAAGHPQGVDNHSVMSQLQRRETSRLGEVGGESSRGDKLNLKVQAPKVKQNVCWCTCWSVGNLKPVELEKSPNPTWYMESVSQKSNGVCIAYNKLKGHCHW